MSSRVWLCDECVRMLFGEPVTEVAIHLSMPMPCGGCQKVVGTAAPMGSDRVDRAVAVLHAREQAKANAARILVSRPIFAPRIAWSDIPGWTDEHLLALYDWAVARAPLERTALFVELGVAFGRSFAYAAKRIEESKKSILLWGFDAWPNDARWTEPGLNALVGSHGGFDKACFSCLVAAGVLQSVPLRMGTVEAAERLPGEGFAGCDFVFVDADHSYEGVLADLRAWWPLVRVGGAIAGHDHTRDWPGVEKACREFFGEGGYEVVGTCFRKVKV